MDADKMPNKMDAVAADKRTRGRPRKFAKDDPAPFSIRLKKKELAAAERVMQEDDEIESLPDAIRALLRLGARHYKPRN